MVPDAAPPADGSCPRTCARSYDVSSLRQVIHAAAPCPIELKQRLFEWLGPVIYEFYGATEGGGTLAARRTGSRTRARSGGRGSAPT